MRVGMLCLVLLCVACTSMNSYAVLTPQVEFRDNAGCFRQCQIVRTGGTNAYLDCLRTCPGTVVLDQKSCEGIAVDDRYQCTNEQIESFSWVKTTLLIGGIVLAVSASAANSSNRR